MKVWDIFFKFFRFHCKLYEKRQVQVGFRWEGVTCEAVMKMKQLLVPILFPEEISVLNAAMCDMELFICLVIIYFYS
jgi:hypothetical protein